MAGLTGIGSALSGLEDALVAELDQIAAALAERLSQEDVAAVERASELAQVKRLVAQRGRPVDAENFEALRHMSQCELARQREVTASAISQSVRNMRSVVATWQQAAEKTTHGPG